MHEYSIVQSLVGRVAEEAARVGATRVHRLEVRIGELSGVEIDLLETAYETFREGSICDGAPMEVTFVPARWRCDGCGQGFARGEVLRCAACERPARLVEGDEIYLDRIEMEAPDHV